MKEPNDAWAKGMYAIIPKTGETAAQARARGCHVSLSMVPDDAVAMFVVDFRPRYRAWKVAWSNNVCDGVRSDESDAEFLQEARRAMLIAGEVRMNDEQPELLKRRVWRNKYNKSLLDQTAAELAEGEEIETFDPEVEDLDWARAFLWRITGKEPKPHHVEELTHGLRERRNQRDVSAACSELTEDQIHEQTHATHCCLRHSCKYGEYNTCPVTTGKVQQQYPCEECYNEEEEKTPDSVEDLLDGLDDAIRTRMPHEGVRSITNIAKALRREITKSLSKPLVIKPGVHVRHIRTGQVGHVVHPMRVAVKLKENNRWKQFQWLARNIEVVPPEEIK